MPATITRQGPDVTARSFGINIYREAYNQGLTPSQLLENMDPTSERAAEDRGLDAFERVSKELGIVWASIPERGIQATTWEDATKTPERRALIHEACARVWRHASHGQPATPTTRAMLMSGDAAVNTLANTYADDASIRAPRLAPPIPIETLVTMTTPISGDAYRSLYIVDALGTDGYRMKRVAEGAEIPATTLVTGEHTMRLYKYGRALRATYEQLRRQRVDRIAFIVARMAIQAEADKVSTVLDVIVNGDGNANTAATVLAQTVLHSGSSAGTLTLQAWLTFKLRFTAAYTPTVVLAQEASMIQLLLLAVPQSNLPLALLPAGAFGSLRPINNQLASGERYGVTSDAPALKLVTFDTSQAVERVVEIGGNVSEVERFINNQTQLLTMTEVEGYGIVDAGASRILDINA